MSKNFRLASPVRASVSASRDRLQMVAQLADFAGGVLQMLLQAAAAIEQLLAFRHHPLHHLLQPDPILCPLQVPEMAARRWLLRERRALHRTP